MICEIRSKKIVDTFFPRQTPFIRRRKTQFVFCQDKAFILYVCSHASPLYIMNYIGGRKKCKAAEAENTDLKQKGALFFESICRKIHNFAETEN
jgi:hypothetical protein